MLTGHPGARLGIGDVLVYVDDNGDGALTETPLGAGAFIDRVVGTSTAWREEDVDESFLVWREGELSSVWKLFRGIYGCADPAEGFSTVTLRALDDVPYVECVIDNAAVPVELDDTALASLACAADPDRHIPQRPSEDVGLPAGAVGACVAAGDGWQDVRYTVDPDSVCPDVERYDLVGCSDLTSEAACDATSWNLLGSEPAWWPCSGFDGLGITVIDDEGALTDGVDDLFGLVMFEGFGSFLIDDLAVVIEGPNGSLTLSSDAFTLDDADNNGAWSVGDALTVHELVGSSFTADTLPGAYPVRIYAGGIEVLPEHGFRSWQPGVFPTITPLEVTAVDAPAPLTFDADQIALVTWTGVNRAPLALEDVRVNCALGGELPVSFGDNLATDAAAMELADDVDDDGLFSRGDTLLLVERTNLAFGLDPEGLSSFGGLLYCDLSIDVGFNAFVSAAHFTVGLDGTPLTP